MNLLKKMSKKTMAILLAVVLVIGISAATVALSYRSTYKRVARKFIIGMCWLDYDKISDCLPYDIDEIFEEYADMSFEEFCEENKDEYAEKLKPISVKILNCKKLDYYDIKDIIEDESYLGTELEDLVEMSKVKRGYAVKCNVVVATPDDVSKESVTVNVVRYKGKWKVLGYPTL